MNATLDFSVGVFGSEARARAFNERLFERFDDPRVYFHCSLFYVGGRVPA